MNKTILALAAGALALTACSRGPEGSADPMATAASTEAMTESQMAYDRVQSAMHAGMADIPADPDLAYMQGMLAHHKGAIAMSEVVLKYGKDAKARDLAGRVIKAQTAEVAEIETWLKDRNAAMPAGTGAKTADHSAHN